MPLTLEEYEKFVYDIPNQFPSVRYSTLPHHKHVPPDLKHHRVPAPHLSFDHPNLPFLIKEIEQTLLST